LQFKIFLGTAAKSTANVLMLIWADNLLNQIAGQDMEFLKKKTLMSMSRTCG